MMKLQTLRCRQCVGQNKKRKTKIPFYQCKTPICLEHKIGLCYDCAKNLLPIKFIYTSKIKGKINLFCPLFFIMLKKQKEKENLLF